MNREELVGLIKGDMVNEYKHWMFYMNAAIVVKGLHREEMSEFFRDQAKSEMVHIEQFGKLLLGLDEVPPKSDVRVGITLPDNLEQPYELLEYAISMEEEVADNYAKRIFQGEELATSGDVPTEGLMIHVFEDQLADSWEDAKHMREMLKGICPAKGVQDAD